MALTKVRGSGLDSSQEGAITFNEGSADVDFRVESNGNANMLFVDGGNDAVVIGHNDSRATLFNTTATASLQIEGTSGNTAAMSIVRNSNDDNGPQFVLGKSNGTSNGAVTVVTDDALLGRISFQGADGTQTVEGGRIEGFVDGTPGADDMPGRLVFSTTADGASSPTERMRIGSDGTVFMNTTSVIGPGIICIKQTESAQGCLGLQNTVSGGSFVRFANVANNAVIGTIANNGNTATSFNTTSDYRLKENVVTDWDATSRLKELKPSRFNWKTNKDKTVDGFIAHEVSSIVPEAITGEKDAVNKDGTPEYQGIDQSKLVPLLTKALQESIARADALEARIKKLEDG